MIKYIYYMQSSVGKFTPLIISVIATLLATAAICAGALYSAGGEIEVSADFFFVCYRQADNSVSAGSISDAVTSYGGAGYVLEYNGGYYVTVSCYYTDREAQSVCANLKKRGLDCTVLNIKRESADLPVGAGNKRKLYEGNFATLYSLSSIAYECANALDTGDYGQRGAKSVIADLKKAISELIAANTGNCFYGELKRIYGVCENADGALILSKDLRKLQIAIADTLINLSLY